MRGKLAVPILAFVAGTVVGNEGSYVTETTQWRSAREARLRAPDGWLSLAGLFVLEKGESSFGSDKTNTIVLPQGTVPARAGVLRRMDGHVVLRLEEGVNATIRGEAVTAPRELATDAGGDPDVVDLGRLQMLVIERGQRVALRVKWLDSPVRQSFAGLRWFPIDERYRIEAQYRAFPEPRTLRTVNVLGDAVEYPTPGEVSFSIDGQTVSLIPILEEGDDSLFFVFRDETSHDETYPGGRFLDAPLPSDGRVMLDFNRAVNPPCAYTRYATCPLPPKENAVPLRIPAGEMRPHGHQH